MKPKLCIALYDISQFAGDHSAAMNLANALSQNYNITLLSITTHGESAYSIPAGVRLEILLPPVKTIHESAIKAIIPGIRFFQKNKYEAVILTRNYTGFVLGTLQPLVRAPFIYWEHGALMSQWGELNVRIMRFWATKLCRHTVVLTEQTKEDYIKQFRIKRTKISCIYNWVNHTAIKYSGYNANSKSIISAGRFGVEKGFDLLVESFSIVKERHPDWVLDIFGNGEMMPVVKDLIKKYHLEQNVHLPGMCSNLFDMYPKYAMYVLPSHREGLPLVLLEAKANHLPIVAFDVMTGPREIIRDGIDGFLVKPEDTRELAEKICLLIEDDHLRCKMSEESQGNIEKFSKNRAISQWIHLIQSLKR